MLRKILISSLSFILALFLSGYLSLSLSAGRPLTISEYTRFSSAILWNTVLHPGENGGSTSLKLANAALSSPSTTGSAQVNGRQYTYPLPKYSVQKGEERYLTFASSAELQDYFQRELPSAGWRRVEQLGAAHSFESEGAGMLITHHFYLGERISELNFSFVER